MRSDPPPLKLRRGRDKWLIDFLNCRVVIFLVFIFLFFEDGLMNCINRNPVSARNQEPSAEGASTEVRPHFG